MKKKIVIILFMLVLLVLMFAGCNEQKTSDNGNVATDTPTINSFIVVPASINEGESANLQWDVSNADSVTLDNGHQYSDLVSEIEINPAITTTYTLTATKGDEETTATVQIIVEEHEDAEKFIGSWFYSDNYDGYEREITFTFLSDRTHMINTSYRGSEEKVTGTWTIVGNKLIYTAYGSSFTNDYSFSNNNQTLTIVDYNEHVKDYTKQ